MAPERVEDHLLAECAKWTGGTDLLIATGEGFEPAEFFAAQLDAFAALGLLTADEVSAWRARFEEAAHPAEPVVVDDALRARIERYLESLLPAGPPADEEDEQLSAAIEALERLGVLSEDEGMGWFDRALRTDPDYDFEDDEDDPPEYEGRELRRVLLGPLEESGGVRVTSVELYDDSVVVRWNMAASERPGDEAEVDFEVSDDVGTQYGLVGGGWGGSSGSERVRGEDAYVPAVPETASRLVLERRGGRVAFELDR